MLKNILYITVFLSTLNATNFNLPYAGVEVTHNGEKIKIERNIDKNCLNIAINNDTIWAKDLIKVSKECKVEFVTTVGHIQPMKIDKDIETIGELEVLEFIKNKSSKYPNKYALIDSRKLEWFNYMTIPSSLSVPYNEMVYDEDFPEDYENFLNNFSIKKDKNGELNFKNAKKVVIFCNSAWCVQSKRMVIKLINLGYPKNKILWYRGGLQSWISMGLTTTK